MSGTKLFNSDPFRIVQFHRALRLERGKLDVKTRVRRDRHLSRVGKRRERRGETTVIPIVPPYVYFQFLNSIPFRFDGG